VKISALGRDLATGGAHDTAKVADLKAKIAAGDFQVDPARIAAAMLDRAAQGGG
jgi:flagellar biosynthesis anti-sigma factor FlgM